MSVNMIEKAIARERLMAVLGLWIIGVLIVAAIVGLSFLGYAVDGNRALRLARDQGFTHVRMVDEHRMFAGFHGCGSGDVAAFELEATNPRDARVRVIVCCGLYWRGCTIRGE